jgi:hypothetical protein
MFFLPVKEVLIINHICCVTVSLYLLHTLSTILNQHLLSDIIIRSMQMDRHNIPILINETYCGM